MFDIANDSVLPLILVTSQSHQPSDGLSGQARGSAWRVGSFQRSAVSDVQGTVPGQRSARHARLCSLPSAPRHPAARGCAPPAGEGGPLAQLTPEAGEPSSSASEPPTPQHLRAAHPGLPTAAQSHRTWSALRRGPVCLVIRETTCVFRLPRSSAPLPHRRP